MKKLQLAKDLALPIDAITQTFLVVGKRGSGKSNTAARLVEQIHHAKLPFVVLDPVDTWWGLKASRDGSGPGLDIYVFGGRKADLPLESTAGALIAEVLCEHRISMVLSVKHLSGRERSAFMVAFAQTLFQKWQGGPLHVVLEEAHELAPQMSGGRGGQGTDNEAAMLGAFKRLWKLGRASGIGGTAVTQRPASLSKDITTQSEILIAHRTIGPQDVKAIGEWVKYHGEHETILGDLPTLPTGEAFVWAPEFPADKPIGLTRATVQLRETYDSASTPKVGEQRVEPKQLADVDLEKLRTKMAATIEKAKADDPRELKKQVADLQRQLKLNRPVQIVPEGTKAPKEIKVPALTDADRALIEKLAGRIVEIDEHARVAVNTVHAEVDRRIKDLVAEYGSTISGIWHNAAAELEERLEKASVKKLLEKLNGLAVTPAPNVKSGANYSRIIPERAKPQPTQRVTVAPRTPSVGDNNGLTPAKQKILNGLAFMEGIGVREADKTQLALIVGVSPTSGAYFNNLGALRTAGLISYPSGGTVALTDEGSGVAVVENVPETTDELHEAIKGKLPPAKWKILEALIAAYPNAVPKEALAESIGVSPTSGAYFNNLGSLRSLGLLDYPRPSEAVAKPVLFLEGR